MTAIQRAGSFASVHVHYHTLVADGVWWQAPDSAVAFHALPPPTDADVEGVAHRVVRRVLLLLAARDADAACDPPEPDDLAHAQVAGRAVLAPSRRAPRSARIVWSRSAINPFGVLALR